MKKEYRRELDSNYLVLEGMNCISTYEVYMLEENRIEGLLPTLVQYADNRQKFCYEITAKQPLSLLLERQRLKHRDLVLLLQGIERALSGIREHLLDVDHLLLVPEFIFSSLDPTRPEFCFYPECDTPIREQFLDLAEYLLGKLDKADRRGVEFGYDIYRLAGEENFSISQMLSLPTAQPDEGSARFVHEPAEEETGILSLYAEENPIREPKPAMRAPVMYIPAAGTGTVTYAAEPTATYGQNTVREQPVRERVIHQQPRSNRNARMPAMQEQPPAYTAKKSRFAKKSRKEKSEQPINARGQGYQVQNRMILREEQPAYADTSLEEILNRPYIDRDETTVLGTPDHSAEERVGETEVLFRRGAGLVLYSTSPDEMPLEDNQELYLIGKKKAAVDACINHPTVSRIHAQIEKQGIDYFLSDLNSTNGTFHNGTVLSPNEKVKLFSGDIIQFGSAEYKVSL